MKTSRSVMKRSTTIQKEKVGGRGVLGETDDDDISG